MNTERKREKEGESEREGERKSWMSKIRCFE